MFGIEPRHILKRGTPIKFRPSYNGWDGVAEIDHHAWGNTYFIKTPLGYSRDLPRDAFIVRRPGSVGQLSTRERLPYGMWTCVDGREVLFNRNYTPIWQRLPGEAATCANHRDRAPWVRQEWFFDDGNAPWIDRSTKQKCEALLDDFCPGILCREPLPLLEAMDKEHTP